MILSAFLLQGIGDRDVGIYVKKVVPGSVADKVRVCLRSARVHLDARFVVAFVG
jgi:hypothetical protein